MTGAGFLFIVSNMDIRERSIAKIIFEIVLLCACLMLSSVANAATHWVSPTGSAAWANCAGGTALSGASACSLATANSNASAGDTVYLRGGTYSGTTLSPSNSGSCPSTCYGGAGASRITFAAYTGETPIITGASFGLSLTNVNWVLVTGITFQNISVYPLYISGASYNEISYNNFANVSPNYASYASVIGAENSAPWSTHNWVHHNYFSRARNSSDACGEAIDLVRIGMDVETGSGSGSDYNTLEFNYMEYGGHSILEMNSRHNVIRGNIAHNEPWILASGGTCQSASSSGPIYNAPTYDNSAYNGYYGHRVFGIGDADALFTTATSTLVEGNRLGFGSPNPHNGGSTNLDLESPYNIARYNFLYGGMDSGIYFKWGNSYGAGTGAVGNHVYNNTSYSNGHGWNAATYGFGNLAYNGEGIAQYSASGTTNNVIVNNLTYGNGYSGQWDLCYIGWYAGANCSASSNDTVTHNWTTAAGNPLFNNPALTDPTSQNLFPSAHGYTATPIPDLGLQAGSPAIDGGSYLTTTIGAGSSSRTLTVTDAWFFQDGTWGSDIARGANFFPDSIAVGTVTNAAQISSINYSTNTITLASPITWNSGAPVWLYKKSDGAQVLYGSAPDYGASESVPPPPGLKAIVP